jgi:hypothetical protein
MPEEVQEEREAGSDEERAEYGLGESKWRRRC